MNNRRTKLFQTFSTKNTIFQQQKISKIDLYNTSGFRNVNELHNKKTLVSFSEVVITVGIVSRCTDWKFQFGTVFGGNGLVWPLLCNL